MGLNYEITKDMYQEVYAMRQDERRPPIMFGDVASLNSLYAPRAVHAIVRKLLSQGHWTSATGAINYKLIACTFQDVNARNKAWDMFWEYHDVGKKVKWVKDGDEWAPGYLDRNVIKS